MIVKYFRITHHVIGSGTEVSLFLQQFERDAEIHFKLLVRFVMMNIYDSELRRRRGVKPPKKKKTH